MAADHLTTVDKGLLYGDYELEMRAPYAVGASPLACNNGVYAYFTAGYVNKDGTHIKSSPPTRWCQHLVYSRAVMEWPPLVPASSLLEGCDGVPPPHTPSLRLACGTPSVPLDLAAS